MNNAAKNEVTYWRRIPSETKPPPPGRGGKDDDESPLPPSNRKQRNIPRRNKPPKRTNNRKKNAAMQSISSLKGKKDVHPADKIPALGVITKPIEIIGSGMDAVGGVLVTGAGATVGATKTVVGGTIGATKTVVGGTIGAIGTVGGTMIGGLDRAVGGAMGIGKKSSSHSNLSTNTSHSSNSNPPTPTAANSSSPGWSRKNSPGQTGKKTLGDSASSFGTFSSQGNASLDNINEMDDDIINAPLNDLTEVAEEDESSEGPHEAEPSDEDKEHNKNKNLVSKVNKLGTKAVTGVGKTVNTVGKSVNGVGRQAYNLLAESFHTGNSTQSLHLEDIEGYEHQHQDDGSNDEMVPTFASRGRGRGRAAFSDDDSVGSGGNMAMMMPNSPGMRTRSKSPGRRNRSKSPGRRATSPGRRAASPGRRAFGAAVPPRRRLDSQRSERPGILQPNIAPSHKRYPAGTHSGGVVAFAAMPEDSAPTPAVASSPHGLEPPRRSRPQAVGLDDSDGRARGVSIMIEQRENSKRGSVMRMDDSNLDQQPRTTRLHTAAADPDSTIQDLKDALNEDPSYASMADEEGKLPLHLISENDMLTDNLGEELDAFILDDLIPKNRKALVAQSNDGHFPFVQALLDWVDLVNEIPQQRISEMGMSLEQKKDEDAAEQLIPWNVVIDDVAFWGIRMLSVMIEREPLKANWVLKIVEVIASIPCFLKNILLIDDDITRRDLLETRLVHEVILHENSVGPWLVYMIVSDDEVAQNRALLYMKLVTDIEQKLSHESAANALRSRVSAAFVTSNHQIADRKHRVYLKAASLPAIIPALMQFTKQNFTEASSSSIVQFILDEALFQPETVLVILLDMFFLFAAVVMFTICSNETFSLISAIKFAPTVTFYVNQTAADMCANGTLTDSTACMYFDRNGTFTDLSSVVMQPGSDCGVNCQVCHDLSNFGESVIPYDESSSAFLTDMGSSPLISCYDGNLDLVIDTLLIASIMFMSLNALYFTVRQLCTWLTVPHRFLRSQLGVLREFFNICSVAFPVVMLTIFLAMIYDLPTTGGSYMSPEFHDRWLANSEIYAACSAMAVGFLYLKILFYFKVLNQYTATFIFALGEVVKDIFWFFWIMVVIIAAFSQMFFTTLSCTAGDCRNPNMIAEVYSRERSPFDTFQGAILYSYAILLGQIDLFLFDTPFTTLLWVLYTFAVVIVVLNFLIAIVGDSYDKSMTKIEMHFGRARLMFMVEVSAFLSYVVAPISGGDEYGYRRMLICGSVKGTIVYLLFAGGLFTGFAFLTIDKNILDRSGQAVYITLSTFLSLLVVSPFLWKFGCLGCLTKFKIFDLLGRVLTAVFRVFLGKSIRGDRTDKEKKDWGGKIAHLITSMNDVIRESEEITNSKISNLESVIQKSSSKMDQQMEGIRRDTENAVIQANRDMDRRVAALELNVLEIKALVSNIHAMMEERREMEESSGGSVTTGGDGGVVTNPPEMSRVKSSSSVYDG
mmetsp:Transcript_1620/g.3375  ORF Transcript_1620/g.3375 Transcript_1620/m.3375 type:complete len:1482 (-) Transcript_1620:308-4753(-)